MSGGVLENIALNIASEVIVRCVQIGMAVVTDAKLYVHESKSFKLRLETQISIWQAINAKFQNDQIQSLMRDNDRHTYADIVGQIYGLMRKYVERKCPPGHMKTSLLEATSAEELFAKLEENRSLQTFSSNEKGRLTFLSGLRQEAMWLVWKKGKYEKLVSEIEFWGAKLDVFASWTIPTILSQATTEGNVAIVADPHLKKTFAKSQVMAARVENAGPSAASGFGFHGFRQETSSLELNQITLMRRFNRSPSPGLNITDEEFQRERSGRTDLGGNDRRQWGEFNAPNGTTRRVIVEFKPCPSRDDARYLLGEKVVTDEIVKLVRTLRAAAEDPDKQETFHVLYCEGWYKEFDHYGLVYQLPSNLDWSGGCQTLGNILTEQQFQGLLRQDLENRLHLARALAWTLFEFHSVNWLHQSFHPDNILLFADANYQFDWSRPFLVGFDSSRTVSGHSGKLNFRGQWTARFYTHPDRQENEYKPYKKIYDIYSLGVVLLELGTMERFVDGKHATDLLRACQTYKLKDVFIEKAKGLKEVFGKAYSKVVVKCLDGGFDDEDNEYKLTGEFRTRVCEKLTQIKIS